MILILLGGYLLAAQFYPQLKFWETITIPWPAWIVGLGGLLLLIGLLTGTPDMAVPATIVAGIGSILWYQSVTGDWTSWGYLWALIPGFVGLGILLAGLLGGKLRENLRSGLWLVTLSLVLVTVFGFLFRSDLITTYWPIALIAVGLLMLVQPLIRGSDRPGKKQVPAGPEMPPEERS
jgi:hypothetical protein